MLKKIFTATIFLALLGIGADSLPSIVALYQGGNVEKEEIQLYTTQQWVNHAPYITNRPFPTDAEFLVFSLNELLFNRLLMEKYGDEYKDEAYINFFTHYYAAQFAHTLTSNRIYREVTPDLGEERLRDFYEEYSSFFQQPPRASFKYLFLEGVPTAKSEDQENLEALAQELYHKATENPKEFDELILTYSQSPYNVEDDLVHTIEKDRMSPDLWKLISNLEENEISEPFPSENGYVIFQLVEQKEEEKLPFSEAKPQIRQMIADSARSSLVKEKKAELFDEYMEDWEIPEDLDYEEDYKTPLFSFPEIDLEITLEKLEWAVGPHDLEKIMNRKTQRERFLRQIAENFAFYFHLLDDEEETILRGRQLLKEAVFRRYYIDEFLKEVEVSEEEARSYYEENIDNFQTGDQYLISQITVSEGKRGDAETTVQQAYQKLKEGNSFEDVAVDFSEDRYHEDGGRVGWVSRPSHPDRDEIMVSLENGEFSQPFETNNGYMIVYRHDERPPQPKPFEEVRPLIKDQLEFHKQVMAVDEYKNDLFEEYKVKIVSAVEQID